MNSVKAIQKTDHHHHDVSFSRHRVWRASECMKCGGGAAVNRGISEPRNVPVEACPRKVVEKSETVKLKPPVDVHVPPACSKRWTAGVGATAGKMLPPQVNKSVITTSQVGKVKRDEMMQYKTRRKSVEFVSKFALKRKTGT